MHLTDEQLSNILEDMQSVFGERLPNPEHEPIRFKYYWTLYHHMKDHHDEQ